LNIKIGIRYFHGSNVETGADHICILNYISVQKLIKSACLSELQQTLRHYSWKHPDSGDIV